MTNNKKIISANDKLVKVNYNSKTWSYGLNELDSMVLRKVKSKVAITDIAFLLLGSITLLIVSILIDSVFFYCFLFILFYIYYRSRIKYYIILSIGSKRVKIKIRNQDKQIVLGEITQFLTLHFNYKISDLRNKGVMTC